MHLHGSGMDLGRGGSPWIWDRSRNFTWISLEFHGSGVDLNGSVLDLGISLEFHRNFMDMEWVSMDLG